MPDTETELPDEGAPERSGRRPGQSRKDSVGILIFGFGTAAGFLLAFMGLGVLQDTLGIILLLFLCILMFIGALGLVLYVFRKPLWRRLFGIAEAQLEEFAEPLAEVALGAVDRDKERATTATRDLVHMALARYAWMSTRRWIIGSLTALIAAMAALAGTAMLYNQNVLIAAQGELLSEQNAHVAAQGELLTDQNRHISTQIDQITRQIELDSYSVQLAEAARNAELVVEITAISAELGEKITGLPANLSADTVLADDLGLVLRISAASLATRPYRFLKVGHTPGDVSALNADALARRTDLPEMLARIKTNLRWPERPSGPALIDRPASPERGQILTMLSIAGVSGTGILSRYGMDLSFSYVPGQSFRNLSLQGSRLSYADFSFAELAEMDFGSAELYNARFRGAYLTDISFASVPATELNPPLEPLMPIHVTFLTGAEFSHAMARNTDFRDIAALGANFDDAAMLNSDFTGAAIAASTFRRAMLLGAKFNDANLYFVDFDGAIVDGAEFLDRLTETALSGTFDASLFELEEISLEEAYGHEAFSEQFEMADLTNYAPGGVLYRVKRVGDFE